MTGLCVCLLKGYKRDKVQNPGYKNCVVFCNHLNLQLASNWWLSINKINTMYKNDILKSYVGSDIWKRSQLMKEEPKCWAIFWFLGGKQKKRKEKEIQSLLILWSAELLFEKRWCPHLLPAPLHEQMDRVGGQAWLQEPQACVQGIHHFCISAVLIGEAAFIVHLPHEHTWGGVDKVKPLIKECRNTLGQEGGNFILFI